MIQVALDKLMQRRELDPSEIGALLGGAGENSDPLQLSALLALLHAKGETLEELFALVTALRGKMKAVEIEGPLVDIVGTGGDGMHTVNISTAASLLASACGVAVVKHGNRAVTSRSGSADLVEELGIALLSSGEAVAAMVRECGFGFCFAPLFHPAMRRFASIRRRLGLRTTLNLVGPLLNPASVDHYLLGVYRADLMVTYGKLLSRLGVARALVVHGAGCDEVTTVAPSKALLVEDGELSVMEIDPRRFGFALCAVEELAGGDAAVNRALVEGVFSGERGPLSDTIVLNAALALFLAGAAKSVGEAVSIARERQRSGDVMGHLERVKEVSRRVACTI